MLLLLLALPGLAQDAITLSAVRYAQEGLSAPSLVIESHTSGQIDATLACSGRKYAVSTAIIEGQKVPIELAGLPRGTHSCSGRLALQAADGTAGEMPLSLSVEVLPPLKLDVRREELDLGAHRLTVRADRPIGRVEIVVLGEGGAQVGQGSLGGGASDALTLEWQQRGGEAIKLRVTAWDTHDLPGELELSPWSYDIPHEDVVFATGSSEIAATEVPKLESAWAELQTVLRKYGSVVEVQLFVAGYTDTVGSAASNQALSDGRARAIATWFRQRGFEGPVHHQGFGESAPAVSTADETDEPRNRRALYLLAAEVPPISTELPKRDWKTLK